MSVPAYPAMSKACLLAITLYAPTGNGSLPVNTNTPSRRVSRALKRCTPLVLEGSAILRHRLAIRPALRS
eukprot:1726812-Rhodomonas_salina.1